MFEAGPDAEAVYFGTAQECRMWRWKDVPWRALTMLKTAEFVQFQVVMGSSVEWKQVAMPQAPFQKFVQDECSEDEDEDDGVGGGGQAAVRVL